MTQEQKDLLLKDLCSRLPYGVKVEYENEIFDVEYVCPMYEEVKLDNHETWTINIDEVKPYLFPLSSMTEEQQSEYHNNCDVGLTEWGNELYYDCTESFDWLLKNKFDIYGLIPMGLANDATDKNIY